MPHFFRVLSEWIPLGENVKNKEYGGIMELKAFNSYFRPTFNIGRYEIHKILSNRTRYGNK
jgi:hypothetical protein